MVTAKLYGRKIKVGVPSQYEGPAEVVPGTGDNKKDGTPLSDRTRRVYANWQKARIYYARQWDVVAENWRFYWGKHPELGLGQWPGNVVSAMIQQGRQLLTYNFIMPTVDNLAGSLMQMGFTPDFLPIQGKVDSLTKSLNGSARVERELMNWDSSRKNLILAGLIGEGVVKMGINKKWSKIGNIGLEYQQPGSVMFDPLWKTIMSSECRRVWRENWMTPHQMEELYENAGILIKAAAEGQKRNGVQYGEWTGIIPFNKPDSDNWGNYYRVIEEYNVIKRKVHQDFLDHADLEEPVGIPIDMPDDDKGIWLDANFPDWRERGRVTRREVEEDICQVESVCPSLMAEPLQEPTDTDAQTGSTGFYLWTANRVNGENHSIVDGLKDPQMSINYLNALISYKTKIEGGGGSLLADPSEFANPQEYEDFVKNRNNPAKVFKVKPGALSKKVLQAIYTSGTPPTVRQDVMDIINVIWPHVSTVTPATMGRPESADMSGKLYDSMKVQADTTSYCLHYGLRLFHNDLYEGYLRLFTDLHSRGGDDGPVERTFQMPGKDEEFKLNERVYFPDGTEGLRNDVRKLKQNRHMVVISESQDTPTQKQANIVMYGQISQNLGPDRVALKNFFSNQMIANVDHISDEDKAILEQIKKAEFARDMAKMEAETAMAESQTRNARMQLQPIDPQSLAAQLAQILQGKTIKATDLATMAAKAASAGEQQQPQPGQPGQPPAPGGPAAPPGASQGPLSPAQPGVNKQPEPLNPPQAAAPQAQGATHG